MLFNEFCFFCVLSLASRNSLVHSTLRCCSAIGSDCTFSHNLFIVAHSRVSPRLLFGWNFSLSSVLIPAEVRGEDWDTLVMRLIWFSESFEFSVVCVVVVNGHLRWREGVALEGGGASYVFLIFCFSFMQHDDFWKFNRMIGQVI